MALGLVGTDSLTVVVVAHINRYVGYCTYWQQLISLREDSQGDFAKRTFFNVSLSHTHTLPRNVPSRVNR